MASAAPNFGLSMLLLVGWGWLCTVSLSGGGAAGNRNSGIGFGDGRGDLRGALTTGVLGVVAGPVIRPNRSGGYDAWNNGELVCRGEKDADGSLLAQAVQGDRTHSPDWGVMIVDDWLRGTICKLAARPCPRFGR